MMSQAISSSFCKSIVTAAATVALFIFSKGQAQAQSVSIEDDQRLIKVVARNGWQQVDLGGFNEVVSTYGGYLCFSQFGWTEMGKLHLIEIDWTQVSKLNKRDDWIDIYGNIITRDSETISTVSFRMASPPLANQVEEAMEDLRERCVGRPPSQW